MDQSFSNNIKSTQSLINVLNLRAKPDFFIMVENLVFSIQREDLQGLGYFSKIDLKKKKVFLIKEELNVSAFQFVMKSLCGKKQPFPRNASILPILSVSRFLGYKIIEKQLALDIINNFDAYDFFLAFKVAQKLNIGWLQKRCLKEILIYDFQMININKTDLLEYDKSSFISVLRKHYNLKQFQIISGISKSSIARVIHEYSQIHGVFIKEQHFCQIDYEFVEKMKNIKQQLAGQDDSIDDEIRKRSSTWDPASNTDFQDKASVISRSSSLSSISIKEQIDELTYINERIKAQSLGFIDELRKVKQKIESSGEIPKNKEEDKENVMFENLAVKRKNEKKSMSIFKKLSLRSNTNNQV